MAERNEWTWEQWCAAARRLDSKKSKTEVELVELLIDLEKRRSIWEGHSPGFAALICRPEHLGLSISAVRYENVKAALITFGRESAVRLGVPAVCALRRIAETLVREKYREVAESWVKEYGRPLSAQAALRLLREVAPKVPNAKRTLRVELADARVRIRELETELASKERALGRTVAELRRAKTLLRKHGIEFESSSPQPTV